MKIGNGPKVILETDLAIDMNKFRIFPIEELKRQIDELKNEKAVK